MTWGIAQGQKRMRFDCTWLLLFRAISDLLNYFVYPDILGGGGVQRHIARYEAILYRLYARGDWCHLLDRIRRIGLDEGRLQFCVRGVWKSYLGADSQVLAALSGENSSTIQTENGGKICQQ